jgi:transmembrane sensor
MLRREAANWLARLQSGRDPDAHRKFQKWHDADPRNAEAFERVRRTYDQAALLRRSEAAAGRSQGIVRPAPVRSPRYALAVAAALAVLVPLGLLILNGSPFAIGGTEVLMLATKVGEIRSVTLTDGTKVTLDTATSVEVRIGHSSRRAVLKSGRARFEVAKAARPFLVEAGSTTVTTGQGMVDIERSGLHSRVEVLAGSADVRQPAQQGPDALTVNPGQSIAGDAAGLGQKGKVPAGPDWTRGMLQFDGTPIAAAVALANRYSNRHILIDEDVGQLRVSGAFRAGDTQGLANALAAAFHLSLRPGADGNLALARKGMSQPRK